MNENIPIMNKNKSNNSFYSKVKTESNNDREQTETNNDNDNVIKANNNKAIKFLKKISKLLKYIIPFCILALILIYLLVTIERLKMIIKNLETNNNGKYICTLAKEENVYITEWIEYYRKLGINKIIIYDNNELEGERFEEVIKKEDLESKFIEIIDVRGKSYIQEEVFTHCVAEYGNIADWIFIIDDDEFLHLVNNETLDEFLNNDRYNYCDYIRINFMCFNDNEQLHYENKSLQERFTQLSTRKKCHRLGKTVVRGRRNAKWYGGVHGPRGTIFLKGICNSLGHFDLNINTTPKPYYKYAYFKHYTIKSTEEFIDKVNKYIRNDKSNIKKIMLFIEEYFDSCKLSLEKIEMFEKEYNIKLDSYRKKLKKK